MGQVEEQEDPGLFGGGNLRGHLWVSRGGDTERKVDKTDSVEGDPQEGRGEEGGGQGDWVNPLLCPWGSSSGVPVNLLMRLSRSQIPTLTRRLHSPPSSGKSNPTIHFNSHPQLPCK